MVKKLSLDDFNRRVAVAWTNTGTRAYEVSYPCQSSVGKTKVLKSVYPTKEIQRQLSAFLVGK